MKLKFNCGKCRKSLEYVPLPRRINDIVIGVCRECSVEFEHEGQAEDMFPYPYCVSSDWEIEVTESGRPAVRIADNQYFFDDPNAVRELSKEHSIEALAYLVLLLAKQVSKNN